MSLQILILLFFAGTTVAAALGVLLLKNVLHAAFSLLISFLGVAALFVFAGAEFLAVSQLMIYVGGILVLMIFGVMFTNRSNSSKNIVSGTHNVFWAILIALPLLTLLSFPVFKNGFDVAKISFSVNSPKISDLGIAFLTEHILSFEFVAILLLIVLVGTVYLAGSKNTTKS